MLTTATRESLLQTDQAVDRRLLGWIILAGTALRCLWALLIPVIPVSDGHAYDMFARTLAEHGVFGWDPDSPFAFWSPGTTFLHAPLYWLFGFHYTPIVILNILMSALLIWTSARVVARFFGAQSGIVTGALIAFWPTLIMYPTILASEVPYLLTSILALDVWTSKRPHWAVRAVIAGLLLGFSALIRPLALLLPFIFAGTMLFHPGFDGSKFDWRTLWHRFPAQFRMGFVCVLAMAVVIAPWTYRNYLLFDDFVLISTNGSVTLWMGNKPNSNLMNETPPPELMHLPENVRADILGQRARAYIADDWLGFVVRAIKKTALLYGNESVGVGWNQPGIEARFNETTAGVLKRLTQLTWTLLFLSALYGTWVLFRTRGFIATSTSPIIVMIAFYTVVHAVTVAQDRYHLSFATQIASLAAIGLLALRLKWHALVAKQSPTQSTEPTS
jgi:hypothetical protein